MLLRAAITFAISPVLIWIWMQPMDSLIETIEEFGVEESSHPEWLTYTAEYFPLIVLLSLIIWVVAAAVQHRGATGV